MLSLRNSSSSEIGSKFFALAWRARNPSFFFFLSALALITLDYGKLQISVDIMNLEYNVETGVISAEKH